MPFVAAHFPQNRRDVLDSRLPMLRGPTALATGVSIPAAAGDARAPSAESDGRLKTRLMWDEPIWPFVLWAAAAQRTLRNSRMLPG